MTRPDLWRQAMNKDMAQMYKHGVWHLVLQLLSAWTMKNCWTFPLKYNRDGQIMGKKARLVAKGFIQIPGVDFLVMP